MNRTVTKLIERKAMGLAASQARFLAITARKADCEFRSMQIAQDKLSITRKMAEITDDYQNSMNQTKLVWDYNGTAEEDQALTYNVMMTPSYLNNYNPHILSTRSGKAVLSSKMAAAAKVISPNGNPVKQSEDGFKDFLNALANNNVITNDSKNSFINELDTFKPDPNNQESRFYSEQRGNGADPLNKNAANVSKLGAFANQFKDLDIRLATDSTVWTYTKADGTKTNYAANLRSAGFMINGTDKDTVTLSDILKNDVYIKIAWKDDGGNGKSVDGSNEYEDVANRLQNKILKDLLGVSINGDEINLSVKMNGNDIVKDKDGNPIFIDSAGKEKEPLLYNALTFNGSDVVALEAYKQAAKTICEQFLLKPDKIGTGDKRKKTRELWPELKETADKSNSFIFYDNKNDGQNCSDYALMNLSNMISYFLTEFETNLNGYSSGYRTSNSADNCKFVTDDPNYNYLTLNKGAITDESTLQTDFYMQLYNNICINGWTQNDDVNDPKYLEQLIKNGTYFITSIGSDGIFYQNRYNVFYPPLKEVKDEDAIAQAEAEFNAMKLQLTVKEDQLDLDMKNLDMEISSLTTEYDTVKSLVSKNVEKVFTMFQ